MQWNYTVSAWTKKKLLVLKRYLIHEYYGKKKREKGQGRTFGN